MQLPNKLLSDYKKLLRLYNSGAVFTAVDTETTGLSPETCRIIELGAVQFDKSGILGTFNTLVNPECPIPGSASNINHITDEMVADAPVIKSVLQDFIKFAGASILIAHNAPFDLLFINKELERSCLPSMGNKAIDTLNLSRWAYPTAGRHNLQFLAQAMNIEAKEAHRACDDARVCSEIFLRCLKDTASVQKL
jgi:exonuclease, DNA polymerase III, epsilon subunit family